MKIIYPRINTFVEKRFHCLFSKKKALKFKGFVIEMKLKSISSEAEVNFFRRAKISR